MLGLQLVLLAVLEEAAAEPLEETSLGELLDAEDQAGVLGEDLLADDGGLAAHLQLAVDGLLQPGKSVKLDVVVLVHELDAGGDILNRALFFLSGAREQPAQHLSTHVLRRFALALARF